MHEITNLDAKGLRHFGLTTRGLIAVLFGVAVPLLFGGVIPWWPFVAAVALAMWGLIGHATLRPVYRG